MSETDMDRDEIASAVMTQRDATWRRALNESHLTHTAYRLDLLAKENIQCPDCRTLIALIKPSRTPSVDAAADHALLLAAMSQGVAMLVPTAKGVALICVRTDGVAVTLDAQGCPILTDELRAALREVMK